ncbi:hypothetical protein UCRNP2_5502 [Neofusicoccum parvum UCRNP2]|uniref:Uncharacterized protein n=1 Tax=Botryosphaeria parva (strain UCR-NP2) TaxID=1287680 RepID=R1GP27_BOTPV|nr:hypothetical protein UCRNP2_5502 [Neofusicoccum parvum UCRNP2]
MPRAKPAAATAPKPTFTPIAPCTGGHCHFHRLRCGHVVKTPLHLPPSACATNCATTPQQDAANEWGAAPFECPICIARALSMLWKMDVCNLKKQLGTLSLADFAAWVHRHYNLAWQKRMAASVDRWIPGHRDCQQLRMAERAMVAWREGEPRAPYPIEGYRRLYERREVHADFWNQQYRDTTVKAEECEAEPGVVYQSVEKEGVHYVN